MGPCTTDGTFKSKNDPGNALHYRLIEAHQNCILRDKYAKAQNQNNIHAHVCACAHMCMGVMCMCVRVRANCSPNIDLEPTGEKQRLWQGADTKAQDKARVQKAVTAQGNTCNQYGHPTSNPSALFPVIRYSLTYDRYRGPGVFRCHLI